MYHLLVIIECYALFPTDNTFSSCVCKPSFRHLVRQLLSVLSTNMAAPLIPVVEVWDVMLKAQGSKSEPIGDFTEDR